MTAPRPCRECLDWRAPFTVAAMTYEWWLIWHFHALIHQRAVEQPDDPAIAALLAPVVA